MLDKLYTNDFVYPKVHEAWFQMVEKGKSSTNVVIRQSLDLSTIPAQTYSSITNKLGRPLAASDHKVPDLMSAVQGKSEETTAKFTWFGSLGFGFLSHKPDSPLVAIAYDPKRDRP